MPTTPNYLQQKTPGKMNATLVTWAANHLKPGYELRWGEADTLRLDFDSSFDPPGDVWEYIWGAYIVNTRMDTHFTLWVNPEGRIAF